MPLMVTRLRKSKAWVKARRNPALGFYMVNLWMAAWHEVPAGSLEDDEDVLADAAMCEASKWPKVREDVLRGWVKCDDGRLYHPVMAERANEAWSEKLCALKVRAAEAAKKAARRRAMPEWLDFQQRRQMQLAYELSARRSVETGVLHHVDHIVPINGEQVCGLHVPWNLRVIPATENMAKSNFFDPLLGIAA